MSGKYRHFIIIEKPVDNPEDPGNPIYQKVGEAFAKISPITGNEQFAFDQIIPIRAVKIELYYLTDIQPQYRITFGDRHFYIKEVHNIDERNFELQLIAIERL